MSSENNDYKQVLEYISEKLNSIDFIKEKINDAAFSLDSPNNRLLKDLCNDIEILKASTNSVTQYIGNLENIQNMALTRAEFEEYQKKYHDVVFKANETIFSELKSIKYNSEKCLQSSDSENIQLIESQLKIIHGFLTKYIETIVQDLKNVPKVDDITGLTKIITDLDKVTSKDIKQTGIIIKEIQSELVKFHLEFQNFDTNKEILKQLSKINEIYSGLKLISSQVEKTVDIDKAIDNVYSRLGENIDFDEVSDKVDIIYENITALNIWTSKIDKLDISVPEISSKLESLSCIIDDTKNIINTLNILKNSVSKLDEKINFEDLFNKMDFIYENIIDNTKNIINTLNILENSVDSKLDEKLNFEDLFNKMDIIYENLSALNDWATKVDLIKDSVNTASDNITGICDKVNIISDNVENVSNSMRNIGDDINVLSDKITTISDKNIKDVSSDISAISITLDNFSNLISDRIDIIYENIGLLNEWVNKLDNFNKKYNDETDNFNSKIDNISETLSQITKSANSNEEAMQNTSDNITDLKERLFELNDDISSVSIRTNKLVLLADDISKEFKSSMDSFSNTMKILDDKVEEFNPDYKYGELEAKVTDIVSSTENLNNAFKFLAEWIDIAGKIFNEIHDDTSGIKDLNIAVSKLLPAIDTFDKNFAPRIELISEQLAKKLGQNVQIITDEIRNNAYDNLEKFEQNTLVITDEIRNNAIENLKKLEQNTKIITEKIHSDSTVIKDIVLRLEKSFNTYKEQDIIAMKDALSFLVDKSENYSPKIDNSIDDIKNFVSKSLENIKEQNIKSIQDTLKQIENKTGETYLKINENIETAANNVDEIMSIKNAVSGIISKLGAFETGFSSFKMDELADIKSSLMGIAVKLNTEVTPNVESLNEKTDKLSGIEISIQKKFDEQANQITSLKNEIQAINNRYDELNDKYERLISLVQNNNEDKEIKDMLNYIISQMGVVNENSVVVQNNQKDNAKVLSTVANKVSDFDKNINKIVSYIEED